jgi:hypothetical protein
VSKLLIPNTCQVPNVLLDTVMPRIGGVALKVLLAIVRQTYGFGYPSRQIGLRKLSELTGLSIQGVLNGIKALGDLIIVKHGPKNSRVQNEYALNIDITTGQLLNEIDQSKDLTNQKIHNRPVKKVESLKPNLKPNNSASRKKRERADTDPRVKTLIAAFSDKYLAIVGSRPIVTGKEAASFKRLLVHGRDVPVIEAAMDRYFANDFYRKTGFDAGGFAKAFNRLNSAGARKKHNYEEGAFPAT